MINICRFFKHKRFEKEYKQAIEECEALKLENKELYRILADLKEERKLKDKYKQECEQKHEIIEELIRERQELQKQLRHQLDMNIAMHKECEELKGRLEYIRQENKNLKDSATAEQIDYVSLKNYISTLEFAADRYRKALEEIEQVINNIFNSCLGYKTECCTPVHNVCGELIKMLDIISKAKEYKSD